ncbi:MAG: FkbM family methyltransferase [Gemmatimonadetes bacterium]|nr:FkbM family methyltransferase [Gemmatimonadota bacterium]
MQLPYRVRVLGQRVFGDVRVRIRSGANRGLQWSLAALGRGCGSGRFARDRIEALACVVQEGDSFWDVGAHKGFISLAAARLVGPSGLVVAIEPASANLRFLERHLQWNGIRNVRVVPAATSDRNGVARFGGPGSSVAFRIGDGPEEISVRTIEHMAVELDLGRPTVLKIDVEGEEAAVLRGARRLLGSDQALLISTHSAELLKECRTILQPFGFRIYESWEIARHLRDGTPWTSDHDMLAIGRDRPMQEARIRALELVAGPSGK